MKRYLLLISAIMFFSFIIPVKAASILPTWQSDDLQFYNLSIMSDSDKSSVFGNEYIHYTRAKTYALNSCGTDSYYIYRNINSSGFNVACFNQVDYKGASITVSSINKYYLDNGIFSIAANVYIKNSTKLYMFNDNSNGTTLSRGQFHYMEVSSRRNSEFNGTLGYKFAFESNIPMQFVYDNLHDSYLSALGISSTTYFVYPKVNIDHVNYDVGKLIISSDGSYRPKDRELTLKKSFNSGTNAFDMGKLVVDFSYDKVFAGKAKFKLQYGSNDWNPSNTPRITSYRLYGTTLPSAREYEEIINSSIEYFTDEKVYYEPDGNETIYEITLNIPDDMCTHYDYRIEFYFENTQNYYLYAYDNVNDSVWTDSEIFLNDYDRYELGKNDIYAFISSVNHENVGSIYFPTNSIQNTEIKLKLFNYNFKDKTFGISYTPITYDVNDYFSYYNFSFKYSNTEILVLKKEKGNESTYFYVPKGYYVSLSDGTSTDFPIKTPDGFIDGDMGDINGNFPDYSSIAGIFDSFTKFLSKLRSTAVYFNQVFEIFFTSLPLIFQMFAIVLFIIICIFFICKIGGWNG